MKSKYTTIGIAITTLLLAGIAIFTAIKLYQTRYTKVTPDDSRAGEGCNPLYYIDTTTSTKTCKATNRNYDSQKKDCDGGTNQTCEANLAQFLAGKTTGICYASESQCQTAIGDGGGTATSCSPKAYFDIVLTNQTTGENSGICKPTTLTFGQDGLSCNNTGNKTCDQYLADLTATSGVNKTGGCYVDTASCQKPEGKTVSFRYFYDGSKCISTNHRYDSQNIDVDDPNHRTCVSNLDLAGVTKKVCYTSKATCNSDNALPTSTATAVATAVATTTPIDQPNSCTLSFSISTVSTPTATATATATSTSKSTPTATTTATSTSKSTSTATATATSTSVAQVPAPTDQPTLPVVGTSWPTILGTGFGIFVIVGSLLLAL